MKMGPDIKECKISYVENTGDALSDRGGLNFMLRYIDNIGICSMIEEKSGHLRKASRENQSEMHSSIQSILHGRHQYKIARFGKLKKIPDMQPYSSVALIHYLAQLQQGAFSEYSMAQRTHLTVQYSMNSLSGA